MSKPLIQIDDVVREMTDEEYQEWLSLPKPEEIKPTKEQLLEELKALTDKINSL